MKKAYIAYLTHDDGFEYSPVAFQTEHEAKSELERLLREVAENMEVTYLSPENPKRWQFEADLLDFGALYFGVQEVKLDWL